MESEWFQPLYPQTRGYWEIEDNLSKGQSKVRVFLKSQTKWAIVKSSNFSAHSDVQRREAESWLKQLVADLRLRQVWRELGRTEASLSLRPWRPFRQRPRASAGLSHGPHTLKSFLSYCYWKTSKHIGSSWWDVCGKLTFDWFRCLWFIKLTIGWLDLGSLVVIGLFCWSQSLLEIAQ